MKSAVLVFPGINRERDMARALRLISGREPAMVWHAETALPPGTDLVVIPGGFSYGDYLRCGAIAARAPIMAAVAAFAQQGGLVLAVCNGFQIACEAGLLPGVLMRNTQLRFICRDVYLRVERSDTPFTRGYNAGQVIRVPVAHGEGNYIADGETIARLEGEGRVLFRYSSPDGMVDPDWNHNGAMNAIAGIINERGNVLGMMRTRKTTSKRRWAGPMGSACSPDWWIISKWRRERGETGRGFRFRFSRLWPRKNIAGGHSTQGRRRRYYPPPQIRVFTEAQI